MQFSHNRGRAFVSPLKSFQPNSLKAMSISGVLYFHGVETGGFEWSIFTVFVFSGCGDGRVRVEYIYCVCIFRVWRRVGLSVVTVFVFSGCGDRQI